MNPIKRSANSLDKSIGLLIAASFNINPFDEQASQPLRRKLSEQIDANVTDLVAILSNLNFRASGNPSPGDLIEITLLARSFAEVSEKIERDFADCTHGPVPPSVVIDASHNQAAMRSLIKRAIKSLGVSEEDYATAL